MFDNRNAGDKIKELFGVQYFLEGAKEKIVAPEHDAYYYETYVGAHSITIERGDCAFWLDESKAKAHLTRGPAKIKSPHFATLIRGYAPENRTCEFTDTTVLPYVNGCSTKQIFPPERPGDPTLQLLKIPPFSSEQAHHIHSTVRSVYVLSGEGTSVVGMNKRSNSAPLKPGTVCVLNKMCPHHFETADSYLVVLPVHVWSTTPGVEEIHPMFNGTFKI